MCHCRRCPTSWRFLSKNFPTEEIGKFQRSIFGFQAHNSHFVLSHTIQTQWKGLHWGQWSLDWSDYVLLVLSNSNEHILRKWNSTKVNSFRKLNGIRWNRYWLHCITVTVIIRVCKHLETLECVRHFGVTQSLKSKLLSIKWCQFKHITLSILPRKLYREFERATNFHNGLYFRITHLPVWLFVSLVDLFYTDGFQTVVWYNLYHTAAWFSEPLCPQSNAKMPGALKVCVSNNSTC